MNFITGILLLTTMFGLGSAVRYRVKDAKGKTCILSDMDVAVIVSYPSKDKTVMVSERIDFTHLPSNYKITTTGKCLSAADSTLASLSVTMATPVEQVLTLDFKRRNQTIYFESLSFAYLLNDTSLFPNANATTMSRLASVSLADKVLSPETTFYSCGDVFQGPVTLSVKELEHGVEESVSLQLRNFRVQIYGLENDAYAGNGASCPGDQSKAVVIAPVDFLLAGTGIGIVAAICTIAGIVVIGFVALATIKRMRRRRSIYRPM